MSESEAPLHAKFIHNEAEDKLPYYIPNKCFSTRVLADNLIYIVEDPLIYNYKE